MTARALRIACIAAVAAALPALTWPVAPAQATFPASSSQGKVAFQSSRDGDNEIFTMYYDGSVLTKLTDNLAGDTDPRWSPDGKRIVFQSNRDGDGEIWAMDEDGTDQVQLTHNSDFDGLPAWSSDGTKIAFTSGRDGDNEIFVMDADGTGQAPITSNTANDRSPAWRNTQIAFVTDRDGNDEVYLMNADGSAATNLSQNAASDRDPNWDPSFPVSLAFASNRTGNFQIYQMDPDGTDQGGLTSSTANDTAPAPSPTGNNVVFERTAGDSEIYSGQFGSANLTNAPTSERRPDWQPQSECCSGLVSPRPRGATPMRVSLVPAFQPCLSPNSTHGPPLAHPSCGPPAPESAAVTVGTPDAGGAAASFVGSMRLGTVVGQTGGLNDSDVQLNASLSDLRCRAIATTCGAANSANGADYTGEVRARMTLRVTDTFSPHPSGLTAATTTDFEFDFSFPCFGTPSTTVGADCPFASSANAVVPSAVRENMRTMWQVGQVRIDDGGADGDGETTGDNTLFAVQGLFVP